MNWLTRIQKWWITRIAINKAVNGKPLNWVEKALVQEKYPFLGEDSFQEKKP